jgi:hypothetical protein
MEGQTFHRDHHIGNWGTSRPCGCFKDSVYPDVVFWNEGSGGNYNSIYRQYARVSAATCGANCKACGGGSCTTCENQKYLDPNGICADECSEGYVKDGAGDEGRICKACQGESRRRDSGRSTCEACDKGEISQTAKDECTNIQNLCRPTGCRACQECMVPLKSNLQQCPIARQEGCYHPGTMWCGQLTEALFACQHNQGSSYPCFYQLLCREPTVCEAWKSEFCGGQTSPRLLEHGISKSSGFNRSLGSLEQHASKALTRRAQPADNHDMHISKTSGEVDADVANLGGLDVSLKGKCVG